MKKTTCWALTGIISGVCSLTAFAQEPADQFKAPADVAAAPADAQKTESGLASKVLKAGTGKDKPNSWDSVSVHYTGWTTDGKMFDSSAKRGQPANFPLKGVIAGWTEGLQLMVTGEKRRFWIPEELAYQGRPGSPAGMLVFDVELLSITPGVKPPEAPADVAAAPADATKTASGLAFKVLKAGDGGAKPDTKSVVKMNFVGWKSDGEFIVDSKAQGPQPAELPVGNLPIKGWTEGVQLMSKGEKRRFWLPEDLAFGKGSQGGPGGPLVFDIELIDFSADPNAAPADVAAAPADATKTESGLAFKVLSPGTGTEKPADEDSVKIEFKGWTAKGQFVGGSQAQGQPMLVTLSQPPIKGWTEALKLMVVGEKRRYWVPAAQGFAQRPGGDDFVFDIELLEIKKAVPAPPVPADVAAAPADSIKEKSGLASKVLKAGTGKEKPTAVSKVKVHYTGWTTDGKMFDSSVTKDTPIEFGLGGVIAGWTEGLQLMVVGEKRRFWIPQALAYRGQPGKPAGMLVFDVELLEFK